MFSLLVAVASAAAAPVPDYLGKPIAQVILRLEDRPIQEDALMDLIETRTGEPLAMEEVRESMEHLISLGRFQDVQVDATVAAGGVVLTYNLVPLHSVERLQFRGSLGLSEGRLREAIAQRHGAFPPVGRAAQSARTLLDLYRSYGYFSARVTPSAEVEHDPERTTLVYQIDAGPRAHIGAIEIPDTSLLPRAHAIDRLDLAPGKPLDEPELRRDLVRIEEDLRRRGYYEADASHRITVRDNGTLADVAVAIVPGPRVQVRFEGDPLPSDKRDELVPVEREGSADEDLLEDSRRRILEYMHAQGHWRATAEYVRERRDGELEIVFTIKKGPVYRVARVEIAGNSTVALAALPAPRLQAGDPFVEATLDADHAAIREQYRKLGFVDVKVEPGVAEAGPGLVDVRLSIAEGPRTLVGSIQIEGAENVPGGSGAPLSNDETLRASMGLAPGRPFYQPQLAADREAVLIQFLNRGYPDAAVDVETNFSADRRVADLLYRVRPGAQVFVGHILIVGNRRTETKYIERELVLKPGAPLGLDDVVESQRRVTAMGLFRRVRITELRRGGPTRDVLVSVEEAPPTSVGYGGGLEGSRRLRRAQGGGAVERLEFAPRGFFEIGRRNLWGKNRSIDLFTRISLRRPSDGPEDPANEDRGFGFSEYRVLGTFREPRAFGWTAEALVTAFVEQAIRSSFNLIRQGVNAELVRRLTPQVSIASRYTFDRNKLFNEQFSELDKPLVDRLFPEVRLSAFSSGLVRDTRDDALDPTKGALLGVEGELAARRIGSEVGFAKTFLQGYAYRKLPGERGIILAGGARLGLATGFRREVTQISDTGQIIRDEHGNPTPQILRDLPASERFFAGGDTTVRGFALDRLGDPTKTGAEATIDTNGFPKGGHALFVVNAELRAPVWRDLGLVAFLDGGNVFARVSHFDFGNLRGGAGFGIRYRSPVGPIRVDLGFKLDRRRFASGELERLTALHISIGQAF